MTKLLYKIPEAQLVLGIGHSKLYELLNSGEIECVYIGRVRRIPAAALEAYVDRLRGGAVGATPNPAA